jgi:predicted nucleic acid-binding protein
LVTCCDTSFLFALYGNDSLSGKAVEIARSLGRSISLSSFNLFEYGNALRLAEFRKLIKHRDAQAYGAMFEAALSAGRLVHRELNLADILAESGRVSKIHTPSGGHRGFDILHVAAAKTLGAMDFLTFDHNQRRLARAVGLKVPV